jgi:hypothetical protein
MTELKLDLAPLRRDVPKVGRNESCPCFAPLGMNRLSILTATASIILIFDFSVFIR